MSLRNPVKYPVKYYSWQDDQAPQLADADGVIKTILKACLVTGYGSKAGAGWTSLFEDAHRIVLRRPLRTGNPPDIKIENGTITGTTVRHRIVAQDNPAGLDDAAEISSIYMLSRQAGGGNQWHCIVTDFAFLLCYQIGYGAGATNLLYVGSAQKLKESAVDYHVAINHTNATLGGTINASSNFFNSGYKFYELRRKVNLNTLNILSITANELDIDNDYFAQPILLNNDCKLPIYCAVPDANQDRVIKQVSINNRQMLRYVVYNNQISNLRPIYIPLDYWEL